MAFASGDIVVERVGDGSDLLTPSGTAVFLHEYAPDETPVQSTVGAATVPVRELVFVDPGIDDLGTILGSLRAGVEAVVLGRNRPAAAQIATALAGRDINVVHVIAHGAPGRVCLAAGDWTAAGIEADADDFAAIGDALGAEGALRLWSCDTGAGVKGATFVARLERATGVRAAAASGRVGAAALGGAWELTVRGAAGSVSPPLSAAGVATYAGVLATVVWKTNAVGDWSNTANWVGGKVPTLGDDVQINSGSATMGSGLSATNLEFNSLTVASGASLTVGSSDQVNIFRALLNNGTITLAGGGLQVDNAGSFTNNGLITGYGLLNDQAINYADPNNPGLGTGTITGGGATTDGLEVQFLNMPVSGYKFTISTASGSRLSFLDSTITTAPITIANGTELRLDGSQIHFTGTETIISGGPLRLNGGALYDPSGLSVGSGGEFLGTGTVYANISGTGEVIADNVSSSLSSAVLALEGTEATGLTYAIGALNTGNPAGLEFDGTATSVAAIAINSSLQALGIGSAGSLTINVAESITNGTIGLAGGTLTDAAGLIIGSGATLSGVGTVNANISGTGTIEAGNSGGTLDLTGTVAGGATFVIGEVSAVLEFSNTATAVSAISIVDVIQTLEIANGGALTIGVAESISQGLIEMAGGSLTDASGLTIGSAANDPAKLIGFGSVSGPLSGHGTIEASGGTLDLQSGITSTGFTALEIANSAASALQFDGAVASGNAVSFLGSAGKLDLTGSTVSGGLLNGFGATIKGMTQGDTIDLTHLALSAGAHADLEANNLLQITDGTAVFDLQLNPNQSFANEFFHLTGDGASGTNITENSVTCYCRDTLILTDRGERPVETLAIGDRVMTMSGALRPIKWIGRRSYGGRFVLGQSHILPICFKAGSLGDNVPRRDLWVSPHHAMYLEGILIESRHLVNGVSVVQARTVDQVEYFHIELDSHDVLIAEGALSESFIDDDSRSMFHNAHEYGVLYPDAAQCATLYYAPRLDSGYEVEAARRHIDARAGLRGAAQTQPQTLRGHIDVVTPHLIAGWAQNTEHPEAPVCLDIFAGDRLIGRTLANRYRDDLADAGLGSGNHCFEFKAQTNIPFEPRSIEVRRSLDGSILDLSGATRRAG